MSMRRAQLVSSWLPVARVLFYTGPKVSAGTFRSRADASATELRPHFLEIEECPHFHFPHNFENTLVSNQRGFSARFATRTANRFTNSW